MRHSFFILIILLASCQKEETKPKSVIPAQINNEYNTFISEANRRNIKLKEDYVKIVLTDNSFKYSGCSNISNHTITIDTTSLNYQFYKEQLMFHEFGHYYLGRPHRDGSLNDSLHDIISIMHPYGVINYFGIYSFKREYYLNELFNENTPLPNWN